MRLHTSVLLNQLSLNSSPKQSQLLTTVSKEVSYKVALTRKLRLKSQKILDSVFTSNHVDAYLDLLAVPCLTDECMKCFHCFLCEEEHQVLERTFSGKMECFHQSQLLLLCTSTSTLIDAFMKVVAPFFNYYSF